MGRAGDERAEHLPALGAPRVLRDQAGAVAGALAAQQRAAGGVDPVLELAQRSIAAVEGDRLIEAVVLVVKAHVYQHFVDERHRAACGSTPAPRSCSHA